MSTMDEQSADSAPTDEELLERMKSMTLKEAKAHVKRKAEELRAQNDSSGEALP